MTLISVASPLLVGAAIFLKSPQQNDVLPTYIVKELKGSDACKQKDERNRKGTRVFIKEFGISTTVEMIHVSGHVNY